VSSLLRERYPLKFSQALHQLRIKSGKSRYRMARYSGVDESYILRLEKGQKVHPSRDVVIKLGLSLVQGDGNLDIWEIDALLLAADHAPLDRRISL